MRLIVGLLTFLYLFSSLVLGQNLKFRTYTVENGLSNNSINTIEIDSEGVLWIGSWDGVNQFDGHEFIVYKHKPNDSKSISNNFIDKIIRDTNNNLWVAGIGNQISLYNENGSFINYKFNQKIKKTGLTNNQNILVETVNQLYTFNGEKFIPCNNCNFYQEKNLWKIVFKEYYPEIKIVVSLKDSKGNLWIGSRNNGVFYIAADKILNLKKTDIQNYKNDPYDKFSIQSNEIMEIKEDFFHNIWIGTKDGGLSRVYKNSEYVFYVTNHPIKNPYLPNETIRAITVDINDRIWLGYYSQGIYTRKKDEDYFYQFNIPKASENEEWNKIRALYTASDGSIFGGTYAGIFRYKNGQLTYFESQNNPLLPNNRNYGFYENQKNQVFIACWGGVALFDLNEEKFIPFTGQNLLEKYHVRDILQVKDELYIATEKYGLLKLKNGKLIRINQEKNYPQKSVYSLWYDDSNDNLWAGTFGGIMIYSTKQNQIVKKITESDGLKSHLIYGIVGHDNQVWLSTTDGLLMVDKNTYKFYIYPGQEGLQASEFSEGAYHIDHKNIIYFGGVKGLNFFNPDNLNLKEDVPIIKLFVDNEKNKGEFTKSYQENHVEFTIDPTFYSQSNGNVIYYKLNGYDEDWLVTNYDKQKIIYNDLPAGDYVFKIKNARNSKQIIQNKLHIQKPFWQNFYFYLILFCLLAFLIVLILIYKRKNQIKKEQILEQKIKDRVKEISIQKQNISQINQELIEKNKEISTQKEELHQLHAKLKTESMELDKFNTYLVKEYTNPLSKISKEIHNQNTDNSKHLQKEINDLINKLLALDYLNNIDKNYQVKNAVVDLEFVTHNIFKDVAKKLDKANIKFNIVKNTEKFWASIDLLCYKLLIKYLITDVCKYPDNQNILFINYKILKNKVLIELNYENELLNKNLYYLKHYSPYYQACKTIAELLNIDIKIEQNKKNIGATISFVPNVAEEEVKEHSKLNWMHLDMENKIDKSKSTMLVWAEKQDAAIVNQILPVNDYNMAIESDEGLLLSAIKSLKVDLFVIYNKDLDENCYKIATKIINKYPEIKVVYITENINYELEYQTIEMGIDETIQLPADNEFIRKKLNKILNYKKNSKNQQNIYHAINQENSDDLKTGNEQLVRRAVEIIQDKMSDSNFNVKELCDALDISNIKCYRIFKEILDIPPSEFIINLKMNKAESLLLNTSLNIAEIAYKTGFTDPKYFSKVFKKTYGKSPKKYQKSKS